MALFDRCALALSGWFCAALLGGCGPISASIAIADAQVALDAANGVQAETYAVYEYRRAELNLRQARIEEGYSEFQAAIDLARESQSFAEQAKDLALNHPDRGLSTGAAKPKQPAKKHDTGAIRALPAGGRSL